MNYRISRLVTVSLVGLSTLLLAGCSIGGGDTYTGVPVGTDGVTVQGTGSVKVVPDGVAFSFSITLLAESTQGAVSSVAKAADEARSALIDAGVDEKDIATQSASVYPEYTYGSDGSQTLKGYRATQNLDRKSTRLNSSH